MDQRIADFIRDHRGRYTREAITQQLIDAGYSREAIDATWKVLDTPDPDDTAGEGFWARFFLILVGINAAVIVLVGLSTGSFFVPERIGYLGILLIALAIGALLAWGIVAAVGPTRLGRTTATVIGVVIPLSFALLIGGSCYALLSAFGPPPRTGTMELEAELPGASGGSGAATCYVGATGSGFSVFGQVSSRPYVTVSVDSFPLRDGPITGEVRNVMITIEGTTEQGPFYSFSNATGGAQLESEVDRGGLAGTVRFTALPADQTGPEFEEPAPDPVSGTISWSCD